MLVAESHAASSLAQAVGRAVGYDTTALLFVDRDTATLSVVHTDDGSVVKVLSRTLHSADAMAVLTEMAGAVAAQEAPRRACSSSAPVSTSARSRPTSSISSPCRSAHPTTPNWRWPRGAALASATAPAFEATTVGLAYSQDPDGATAGSLYAGLAGADTQLAAVEADEVVDEFAPTEMREVEEGRKPFLLVGSALTSIFVIGVVALVISLAVSIRLTGRLPAQPRPGGHRAEQSGTRPEADRAGGTGAGAPGTLGGDHQATRSRRGTADPAAAPRTVYVEQAPAPAPAPAAPAPAPAAPAPAPAAPAPVVAPPVVVPPPVIVVPRRQWPVWQPKPAWTWPNQQQAPEPEEPESPWTPR